MGTWRVYAELTVAGEIEADTEEEALERAAAAIVEEAEADIGSYDGDWGNWLAGRVSAASRQGKLSAFEEE